MKLYFANSLHESYSEDETKKSNIIKGIANGNFTSGISVTFGGEDSNNEFDDRITISCLIRDDKSTISYGDEYDEGSTLNRHQALLLRNALNAFLESGSK